MTNQKPTDKAYVKQDNQVTIVCPECDRTKTISVKDFRDKQHVVKVRCKCGHAYRLQLEFRKHFRKETSLQGTYDVHPPGVGGGKTKVLNLSLSGACLEVQGMHDLKVGHKGELVFTLDNRKESILYKQVIIRSVTDKLIGCEFIEDQAYKKELGFYLLP
ncbi:MAG: hypothetical protein GY702_21885 [Desulfobulbaceae bacterium]|nr:hypothetical protein [Desulfobulbaceae bacterium]